MDIMEMFADRVLPEPNSGCWFWTNSLDSNGYGQTSLGKKRPLVHRLSYELSCGPIPQKHDIDHLCRVRCCVNPAHLEAVTERENTVRSPITLAGQNSRKTHCKRGHELTGWNLIVVPPKGTPGRMHEGRACRACMYDRIEDGRRRAREAKASVKGYSGRPKGAHHHQARCVLTPDGRFASVAAAAAHHGISESGAQYRASRELLGWRYVAQDADSKLIREGCGAL